MAAIWSDFETFHRAFSTFFDWLSKFLTLAGRSFSLEEIHCIVFDAPDDSDDLVQSWEEESEEEISDPDETEEVEIQELADNSGGEQRPSTSETCEQTQNHSRRVRKRIE